MVVDTCEVDILHYTCVDTKDICSSKDETTTEEMHSSCLSELWILLVATWLSKKTVRLTIKKSTIKVMKNRFFKGLGHRINSIRFTMLLFRSLARKAEERRSF